MGEMLDSTPYTLYHVPCTMYHNHVPKPCTKTMCHNHVPDVSNEMENVFHDREGVCPVETMRKLAEI
jgi:hypothetical protein